MTEQDRNDGETSQVERAAYLEGVAAVESAFDRMFSDERWDGHVSLGFAATFAQELDLLREETSQVTTSRTPWRVGRKVGRTVYDADDRLIGVMDRPQDAALVVAAVNADELRNAVES